jgi:hypothetical protein
MRKVMFNKWIDKIGFEKDFPNAGYFHEWASLQQSPVAIVEDNQGLIHQIETAHIKFIEEPHEMVDTIITQSGKPIIDLYHGDPRTNTMPYEDLVQSPHLVFGTANKPDPLDWHFDESKLNTPQKGIIN